LWSSVLAAGPCVELTILPQVEPVGQHASVRFLSSLIRGALWLRTTPNIQCMAKKYRVSVRSENVGNIHNACG
jgi:hypothetical protein